MHVLLCKPRYFDVPERDQENNYMDPGNRPDKTLASSQHEILATCYEGLGIDVSHIEPVAGLVDMTFTANLGLTCIVGGRKRVILSNFKPERRRGESLYFHRYFENLGYEIVTLPPGVYFEGAGDAVVFKDQIILGYGFRTNKLAIPYIEKYTEREVIPVELRGVGGECKNPYHLDTALLALPDADTAVLYRGALTAESFRRLARYVEVAFAEQEDAEGMALNGVVVPRDELALPLREFIARRGYYGVVVTSSRATKAFFKTLITYHYMPLPICVSEFIKSGGGAFCLTKILP